MIEKGTIRKMGQYYRNDARYSEEVLRGIMGFFGEAPADSDHPFFNEWMMYDFKFSDGKGMLEKFYYENPLSIPLYRREIYGSLMENYYGFFEVVDVRRFKGLSLRRLIDEKEFDVTEMSATMDLDIGDVFPTRIAKVMDHYEIVGADSQVIKSSQARSKKERDKFIETISSVNMETPRDAFRFFKNTYNQNAK